MWFRSILPAILVNCASLFAQTSILERPDMLFLADSCLNHSYNFEFELSRHYQKELEETIPDNPAPWFLEAMNIYWENFPLSPDNPNSERFIQLLDYCVELSGSMQEYEATKLEGIFFDLFSRAFKAMFWADNGKSGKVVPDLGPMYRHTKEGFELMDQFNEFYFSTGLYNYYIEAYPQAHPGYKALVAFMQDGDRELGLEQLNHAIENTTFVKVQSLLFMTIIQLNYENDLKRAAFFAEGLHTSYPQNLYFQGLLLSIYLYLEEFDRAGGLMELIALQEDAYSRLLISIGTAFRGEMNEDIDMAESGYLACIRLAESIGPFTDTYMAIAYMGLSRIHQEKGMDKEANKYAKKAKDHTAYTFIIGE